MLPSLGLMHPCSLLSASMILYLPLRGTVQLIPKNSTYERETIVEPSASSWSHYCEPSARDDPNPGDGLIASSFPNKGTGFNRAMSGWYPQPTKIVFECPPLRYRLRCSSEAKQLYPTTSTNSLDDGFVDPDPFLGGYRASGHDALIGTFPDSSNGTIYSYGSMADTVERTITFNTPTQPTNAPFGHQYAPLPINPAPPGPAVMVSWVPSSVLDGSNVGTLQQDMEYGSIENYGQGPPISYASGRTLSNDSGPEYTIGPSSSRIYYVADMDGSDVIDLSAK
ncbi:hypothetical protein F5146DRAFT_1005747 [Armillaria mellea]|nr:hypothetical protein F5146DRAFT_1005747 [Armillaria mellea]